MKLADLVVVGSGAAGAWAAWQAARRGARVLVLDVGARPPPDPPLTGNLYDLRRSDPGQAAYLIGEGFESLQDLHRPALSPKLKSPRFAFVTERAASLGPLDPAGARALQSFALGGLANAWGAGAYRFSAEDLKGFPFDVSDLEPYFETLTAEIGVSGADDDLSVSFGPATGLQEPLRLDRLAAALLRRYERRRGRFHRAGIRIGRPRLAILSRPHAGRAACAYDNLSFWQPGLEAIYSPAMTMTALIAEGRVAYRDGLCVTRFREEADGVVVEARDLRAGRPAEFRARCLVLAAGALNSARIVLQSRGDTVSRLPFLENPTSLIPFIDPASIGRPPERESHGLIQLNLLYEGPLWEGRVQGSLYCYSSLLASEVCLEFPMPARGVVAASRYLLPAMAILQLYYPDRPCAENSLGLTADGRLVLRRDRRPVLGAVERHVIRAFRAVGFLSHPAFIRYPEPGTSIHYAGTLPMDRRDVPYGTDRDGRLAGHRAVFVADAATFPTLPAKNLTFTAMANAMRIADRAVEALGLA